jgi:hypothetical protein
MMATKQGEQGSAQQSPQQLQKPATSLLLNHSEPSRCSLLRLLLLQQLVLPLTLLHLLPPLLLSCRKRGGTGHR